MKVYAVTELMNMRRHVAVAKEMWRKSCAEEMAKNGDWGSCVLGEKLYIMVKDGKKEIEFTLLTASDVTNAQGSCVWETGIDTVIAYLQSKGIDAHFAYGHLD